MRLQRGAYGCHLPARGGPPTCAGLLLAWWGVGGAVGGRGRFAARYALLQHCLDFLQLLFLELCFTALCLEIPTPVGFLPFFGFGGVEDASRLCRFGFLFRLGELDLVVYGGKGCGEPLLGFLVVAEVVLGSLGWR